MSTPDGSNVDVEGATRNEYRYERAPDERPSEAVVTAVGEAAGRPVVPHEDAGSEDGADALSPLYEKLDPDALDAFVMTDNDQGIDRSVSFTYEDHAVTVQERVVTVTPVE